jgi:hypothetical protein
MEYNYDLILINFYIVLFSKVGVRDETLALLFNFIILKRETNPPALSDTLQGRLLYWF